jgi:hypothetical protein
MPNHAMESTCGKEREAVEGQPACSRGPAATFASVSLRCSISASLRARSMRRSATASESSLTALAQPPHEPG